MTNKEYIIRVKEFEIDNEKVAKAEKYYNAELPLLVKAMISNAGKPTFLENCRVLSYSEILNANEELDVDFIDKEIIPLVDCGENDFIVYHFDIKKWSMYNIIEDCFFMQKESLEELLK